MDLKNLTEGAVARRIHRKAQEVGLSAASKTICPGYQNRLRKWWFSDRDLNGQLRSPFEGLDDKMAVDFLDGFGNAKSLGIDAALDLLNGLSGKVDRKSEAIDYSSMSIEHLIKYSSFLGEQMEFINWAIQDRLENDPLFKAVPESDQNGL